MTRPGYWLEHSIYNSTGRIDMGRGILKAKKNWKLRNQKQLIAEIERLSAENKALKEDPQSVVGKFINEFNEVVNQNQRLSALTCAMIEKYGEPGAQENSEKKGVVITRDEIENFRGKRLQVKIETPKSEGEDVKFEEAKSYIFSYDAFTKEETDAQAAAEAAARAAEAEIPECTDPNCTLPKDLKHRHQPEAPLDQTSPTPTQVLGEKGPEVTDQAQELGEQAPELVQPGE